MLSNIEKYLGSKPTNSLGDDKYIFLNCYIIILSQTKFPNTSDLKNLNFSIFANTELFVVIVSIHLKQQNNAHLHMHFIRSIKRRHFKLFSSCSCSSRKVSHRRMKMVLRN